MKNKFGLIFLIVIVNFSMLKVHGQSKSGIITYTVMKDKSSFNETLSNLEPSIRSFVEEKLKKESIKIYTLKFNGYLSEYKQEDLISITNSQSQSSWSPYGLDLRITKNLKTKTVLLEKDLMGKIFVVRDSLKGYNWEITNEAKKIGDYLCYKALCKIPVSENEMQEYLLEKEKSEKSKTNFLEIKQPKETLVTAWFTPEIPVNIGPNIFFGLPGLILEMNDGGTNYLATSVIVGKKAVIKEPTEYLIDKFEFDLLVEKKIIELDNK